MKKLIKYTLMTILLLSMNGCINLGLGVGFDIPIVKNEDTLQKDLDKKVLVAYESKASYLK